MTVKAISKRAACGFAGALTCFFWMQSAFAQGAAVDSEEAESEAGSATSSAASTPTPVAETQAEPSAPVSEQPATTPAPVSDPAAAPADETPMRGEPGGAIAASTDVQAAQTVQPEAPAPAGNKVGGHVGIATPLITVTNDGTDTIADQFTLLHPIGVTVKLSDKLAVDFEMVVANPIDPAGAVGLVVDPGVVYDAGPVAVGLRAAWQITAPTNFGLIPLVNRGLVDLGGATWFVEAAFPTFYSDGGEGADSELQFNVVLHTGVGF